MLSADSNTHIEPKHTTWLKMGQAMRKLNVCRDTMRKYCQEGLVRAEKLPSGHWRIESSSIDKFLENESGLIAQHLQELMLQ